MMNKRIIIKYISIGVILAMVGADVGYAAPMVTAPVGIAVQRLSIEPLIANPSAIQLPYEHVSVKDFHVGTSGKLIIHIQDAHANLSGQKSMAKALDALMTQYDLGLVLVEGSDRNSSLDSIRKLAPLKEWKVIARRFLYDGLISGEEYLNLTTEHAMQIKGIEYRELYDDSIRAYAALVDKRKDILQYLYKSKQALEKLKVRYYPESLLNYESQKESTDAPQSGFQKQINALLILAELSNTNLADYAEVQKLKKIQTQEDQVDFEQANQEQKKLFSQLIAKGAKSTVQEFLAASKQFKGTQMSQYLQVTQVLNVAKQKQIAMHVFPELLVYQDYLKQFIGLHMDRLLKELERLEDNVYNNHLSTNDAKKVRAIDRFIGLLGNAYKLQMSSHEFDMLKFNEGDFKTESWLSFLNQKLVNFGFFESMLPKEPYLDEARLGLGEFYTLVGKRDLAFIENAERIMDDEDKNAAILIAGGYHTEHLKQLLEESQHSYLILTPTVKAVTDHAKYEEMLLASFRSKEKLLKQKLGDNPYLAKSVAETKTPRGLRIDSWVSRDNEETMRGLKRHERLIKSRLDFGSSRLAEELQNLARNEEPNYRIANMPPRMTFGDKDLVTTWNQLYTYYLSEKGQSSLDWQHIGKDKVHFYFNDREIQSSEDLRGLPILFAQGHPDLWLKALSEAMKNAEEANGGQSPIDVRINSVRQTNGFELTIVNQGEIDKKSMLEVAQLMGVYRQKVTGKLKTKAATMEADEEEVEWNFRWKQEYDLVLDSELEDLTLKDLLSIERLSTKKLRSAAEYNRGGGMNIITEMLSQDTNAQWDIISSQDQTILSITSQIPGEAALTKALKALRLWRDNPQSMPIDAEEIIQTIDYVQQHLRTSHMAQIARVPIDAYAEFDADHDASVSEAILRVLNATPVISDSLTAIMREPVYSEDITRTQILKEFPGTTKKNSYLLEVNFEHYGQNLSHQFVLHTSVEVGANLDEYNELDLLQSIQSPHVIPSLARNEMLIEGSNFQVVAQEYDERQGFDSIDGSRELKLAWERKAMQAYFDVLARSELRLFVDDAYPDQLRIDEEKVYILDTGSKQIYENYPALAYKNPLEHFLQKSVAKHWLWHRDKEYQVLFHGVLDAFENNAGGLTSGIEYLLEARDLFNKLRIHDASRNTEYGRFYKAINDYLRDYLSDRIQDTIREKGQLSEDDRRAYNRLIDRTNQTLDTNTILQLPPARMTIPIDIPVEVYEGFAEGLQDIGYYDGIKDNPGDIQARAILKALGQTSLIADALNQLVPSETIAPSDLISIQIISKFYSASAKNSNLIEVRYEYNGSPKNKKLVVHAPSDLDARFGEAKHYGLVRMVASPRVIPLLSRTIIETFNPSEQTRNYTVIVQEYDSRTPLPEAIDQQFGDAAKLALERPAVAAYFDVLARSQLNLFIGDPLPRQLSTDSNGAYIVDLGDQFVFDVGSDEAYTRPLLAFREHRYKTDWHWVKKQDLSTLFDGLLDAFEQNEGGIISGIAYLIKARQVFEANKDTEKYADYGDYAAKIDDFLRDHLSTRIQAKMKTDDPLSDDDIAAYNELVREANQFFAEGNDPISEVTTRMTTKLTASINFYDEFDSDLNISLIDTYGENHADTPKIKQALLDALRTTSLIADAIIELPGNEGMQSSDITAIRILEKFPSATKKNSHLIEVDFQISGENKSVKLVLHSPRQIGVLLGENKNYDLLKSTRSPFVIPLLAKTQVRVDSSGTQIDFPVIVQAYDDNQSFDTILEGASNLDIQETYLWERRAIQSYFDVLARSGLRIFVTDTLSQQLRVDGEAVYILDTGDTETYGLDDPLAYMNPLIEFLRATRGRSWKWIQNMAAQVLFNGVLDAFEGNAGGILSGIEYLLIARQHFFEQTGVDGTKTHLRYYAAIDDYLRNHLNTRIQTKMQSDTPLSKDDIAAYNGLVGDANEFYEGNPIPEVRPRMTVRQSLETYLLLESNTSRLVLPNREVDWGELNEAERIWVKRGLAAAAFGARLNGAKVLLAIGDNDFLSAQLEATGAVLRDSSRVELSRALLEVKQAMQAEIASIGQARIVPARRSSIITDGIQGGVTKAMALQDAKRRLVDLRDAKPISLMFFISQQILEHMPKTMANIANITDSIKHASGEQVTLGVTPVNYNDPTEAAAQIEIYKQNHPDVVVVTLMGESKLGDMGDEFSQTLERVSAGVGLVSDQAYDIGLPLLPIMTEFIGLESFGLSDVYQMSAWRESRLVRHNHGKALSLEVGQAMHTAVSTRIHLVYGNSILVLEGQDLDAETLSWAATFWAA